MIPRVELATLADAAAYLVAVALAGGTVVAISPGRWAVFSDRLNLIESVATPRFAC